MAEKRGGCDAGQHRSYQRRHAVRFSGAVALGVPLVIFFGFRGLQAWWNSGPVIGHLLILAFCLGIIGFVWWLMESQDPDPDPAATKRNAEQRRTERAAAAEIRAAENAVIRDAKAAARAEQKAIDAERAAMKAAEDKIRNEAAAEVVAGLMTQQIQQQLQAQRSNRVLELMVMFETNPKKALKLASQEGIDLHAEAMNRLGVGVGAIGFALGAGLQAGSEVVKEITKRK